MNPLSHSAAHEQLADLALEPAAFRRLARELGGPGRSQNLGPLAAHIATCADCRAEIETWERVHGTIQEALAGADGDDDAARLADLAREEPVRAPAKLRAAVQAIATREAPAAVPPGAVGRSPVEGVPAPDAPRAIGTARSLRRLAFSARLLPLVAVLAVVAVAGNLLLDQSRQLDRATADAAALAAVTATLDRVIVDPDHKAIELRTADGSAGGSVIWSRQDLVVLTTALVAPAADVVYRCWIERDGVRSPVGKMFFAGGTGYWTGSLDEWATTTLAAGGTFGISLEPAAGSVGNPAVLEAPLGG